MIRPGITSLRQRNADTNRTRRSKIDECCFILSVLKAKFPLYGECHPDISGSNPAIKQTDFSTRQRPPARLVIFLQVIEGLGTVRCFCPNGFSGFSCVEQKPVKNFNAFITVLAISLVVSTALTCWFSLRHSRRTPSGRLRRNPTFHRVKLVQFGLSRPPAHSTWSGACLSIPVCF